MNRLAILPCGAAKIWDKYPDIGPKPAREVYISPFHQATRTYADRFIGNWVILSAKHGFLSPDDIVPENYDVAFSMPKNIIIPDEQLKAQIIKRQLDQADELIVLGGKKYHRVVERLFHEQRLCYPLAGCRGIGYMLQTLNHAINQHEELSC